MKLIHFVLRFPPLLFFIFLIQCCNSENPTSEIKNSPYKNNSKKKDKVQDVSATLYPEDLIYFSQSFLSAVRYEDPIQPYLDTLSHIEIHKMESDLNTQNKKLAFWINIYNSLVQVKLLKDENSFNYRDKFFTSTDIDIANFHISLDDIEHGILRLKEYNNQLVTRFQLDQLDYRIHFTMNCGATSCPAIAYYNPESLIEELIIAEKLFIEQNSNYDENSNTLYTSELLEWFIDDFGGKEGIIDIMKRNKIIPPNVTPNLKYKTYNWKLKSKNYN